MHRLQSSMLLFLIEGVLQMIDWNVRVGDILVVLSLAGSIMFYAFRSGQFAESIKTMQREIKDLKDVAKQLAAVIIDNAVMNTRLNTAADRLNLMDKKIEDLRRGDGFIHKSINREY